MCIKKWSIVLIAIVLCILIIISIYIIVYPKNVNNPPTAKIISKPYAVFRNEGYNFIGIGNDSDGRIVLYEWDFDGDGIYDHSSKTSGSVTYTYRTGVKFNITFRVKDDDGATATDSFDIFVFGRTPPFSPGIEIKSPSYGDTINGTINITGEADSGGESRLNITSIEIQIDDSNWMTTNFTFNESYPEVSWYFLLNSIGLENGEHLIVVRVVDDLYPEGFWNEDDILIIVDN